MSLVKINEELMLNTESIYRVHRNGGDTCIDYRIKNSETFISIDVHDPHSRIFDIISDFTRRYY